MPSCTLGGGKLVDALGTRLGFTVIMTFWSLANASHALATSFAMLMGSRFLLGMGEGGGFPAATRAVAEWFPPKERATAMGIINAGTAVGAVIAPPLIALILGYSGLAVDFCGHRRHRIALDAGGGSHLIFRRENPSRTGMNMQFAFGLRELDRRDFAGSICCGFASPGDWSAPSFSAMRPGTSIFSGCRNIFTMRADSTSRRSARLPGFLTRPRELAAFSAAGFRATW